MKNRIIIPLIVVLLCAHVLLSGCISPGGSPVDTHQSGTYHPSQMSFQQEDLNTVPVGTAYNQTLSTFWRFAIDGPYAGNGNWTTSFLDPFPSIIYDVDGEPLYYEFYLRSGSVIPGYFWTAANKTLGVSVIRIYEGAPLRNYSLDMIVAEPLVTARYPDFPVLSKKPVIYSDPHMGSMFTLHNTTSGSPEKIIVDSSSHAFIPDQPSQDYNGRVFAWSYLDAIPRSDWPARVAQWELQDSNATSVVEYVIAQGIDVRLPLTPQNMSIIRGYYETESRELSQGTEPAGETGDSYLKNDGRPITDELIRENVVPADTARVQAQARLWQRQVDRPDIYDGLTWRGALLGSRKPAVVEDIDGRTLFYLFSVERNGQHIDWIVIGANKLLGSWLTMPSDNYDFSNVTLIAKKIAEKDLPGSILQSSRFVYCNSASRGGLWMVQALQNPYTGEKERIIVDTRTLNATVEKNPPKNADLDFPSLFTRVETGESPRWIWFWNKDYKTEEDLVQYARAQGIPADRPLTNEEIVILGTYIRKNDLSAPLAEPFNPLYPEPAERPALDPATRAWHERADWFTYIEVDGSLSDEDIRRIAGSFGIRGKNAVRVWPPSIEMNYCLQVPVTDYNRTFQILTANGSARIHEPVSVRWEYVTVLKRENGIIIVPVSLGAPQEANYLRLVEQGVNLKPMKTAEISIDSSMKKAEREKLLAELSADDRILFVRKEYPG